MNPTLIILCIAAYFAVGYCLSVWAYAVRYPIQLKRAQRRYWVRNEERTAMKWAVADAAVVLLLWPAVGIAGGICQAFHLLTRPHRYFAALVQRLNTPAPIQEPGAFARREEKPDPRRLHIVRDGEVTYLDGLCDAYGQPLPDPPPGVETLGQLLTRINRMDLKGNDFC